MPNELAIPLLHQTALLFLLALPIACIAWTVTHEEVFREPREFCKRKSETSVHFALRKFYLPLYVRVLLLALRRAARLMGLRLSPFI